MDRQTILDALFYFEQQTEQMKAFMSHLKEGSKTYEWYEMWKNKYDAAREMLEDYASHKNSFDMKHKEWYKGNFDDNGQTR